MGIELIDIYSNYILCLFALFYYLYEMFELIYFFGSLI